MHNHYFDYALDIYIYVCVCDVHLCYRHFMETTGIDNLPMSPTSIGRVAVMLRLLVA